MMGDDDDVSFGGMLVSWWVSPTTWLTFDTFGFLHWLHLCTACTLGHLKFDQIFSCCHHQGGRTCRVFPIIALSLHRIVWSLIVLWTSSSSVTQQWQTCFIIFTINNISTTSAFFVMMVALVEAPIMIKADGANSLFGVCSP